MGVPQYVYPMGLMSAVAFSWGIILIMADRKAIERRWILIPTSIVVALLGGVALHAGITEILPYIRVIPVLGAAVVVLFILIFSYVNSRDLS
jgi:predicted benzoate:H+ symporter BenE